MHYTLTRDSVVCDFCSSDAVEANFRIPDFELYIPELPFNLGSKGGFAACRECAQLVKAGLRDSLLDRSVTTFYLKFGEIVPRHVVYMFVSKLHDEFWKRYKGGDDVS